MGQFSWVCALCDQEVMHGRQPGYEKFKRAVILWPNGDRRSGVYEEGYGNIAGVDLVDQLGGWRLVHQHCYAEVRDVVAEDLFPTFKPDRHASDQGWWPGERRALKQFGPPNFAELTQEKTYVCKECKRTWEAKWSAGVCPFGCVRPKNYRDDPKTVEKGWGDDQEMVEPMEHLSYELGTADGLIVCRNEFEERPDWDAYHAQRKADALDKAIPRRRTPRNPPTKIEPCFYHGELIQARITKPEEWDEMTAYMNEGNPKPFMIQCQSCKSDNVEILELTPADAPNICEFCGHESEDGCHQCEVYWCGGCRLEHDCPGERSDGADEK